MGVAAVFFGRLGSSRYAHSDRFRISDCVNVVMLVSEQQLRCYAIAGRFQQRDAAGFDHFLAADRADAFARLGFEADLMRVEVAGCRRCGGGWRPGSRPASAARRGRRNRGSRCGSRPRSTLCGGGGQHLGRVAAAVGRVGVGKQAADVGQGGGAQQGVGHGVQQHVGVAVADKLPVVRHVDAAQPQRPARRRAVRVFANSNPQVARERVSSNVGECAKLVESARIIPDGENRDNAERSAELNRHAACARSAATNSIVTRPCFVGWLAAAALRAGRRCGALAPV